MIDPESHDELDVGLYEAVKAAQALERLTSAPEPAGYDPDTIDPLLFSTTMRVHCEVPDSVAVVIAATCRRNRKAS